MFTLDYRHYTVYSRSRYLIDQTARPMHLETRLFGFAKAEMDAQIAL